MTRFLEWPYWLPTLRGARQWLTAGRHQLAAGAYMLGITRRR